MHHKLQCLQPTLVNKKGSIPLHDKVPPQVTQLMLQKSKELGDEVLPHPSYSPNLSPTDYHFFKHLNNIFADKMLPQPAGCRKFRVLWIPKNAFLHYRYKQTFLIAKNVLTIMVPILINKDVFESSYNDLKSTVQNSNYVCTNLITF